MEKKCIYKSPFGPMLVKYTNEFVTSIKRVESIPSGCEQKPNSTLLDKVFSQLNEYFAGKRKEFDFDYCTSGTDFQKKVWAALCTIPYGETRSYKDIAIAVGNPKASRAVGLANNKNPMTIVVPCHRVIASSGKLTGYFGGLEMKQSLLDLEAGKLSY